LKSETNLTDNLPEVEHIDQEQLIFMSKVENEGTDGEHRG
jgi:hypothetical protein